MKLLLTWLTIFMTYQNTAYSSCRPEYPTIWQFNNTSSSAINVSCRVYHGGWSYQHARDIKLNIGPDRKVNYTFSDHNDGLGMIHRNWSCAFGSHLNPLMTPDSEPFSTRGCPNTTITLPDSNHNHSSDPDKDYVTEDAFFCPKPDKIERKYRCESPRCTWDYYGASEWQGVSSVISNHVLKNLEFIGVDASSDFGSALGCVYYAPDFDHSLILISHLKPEPGSFPKFRFKPKHSGDFSRNTGYLRQCLADNPEGCPLVLR